MLRVVQLNVCGGAVLPVHHDGLHEAVLCEVVDHHLGLSTERAVVRNDKSDVRPLPGGEAGAGPGAGGR